VDQSLSKMLTRCARERLSRRLMCTTASSIDPEVYVKRELVDKTPFTAIGLSREIATAIDGMNFTAPTEVQRKAIPVLLENPSIRGRNIIIASETGSGKTIGFAAPILDLVKADEVKKGVETKIARPRALFLVPTRELAHQTSKVIKDLARSVHLRVGMFGAKKKKIDNALLAKPLEIVITTPSRALALRDEEEKLFFGSCKYLVIDEADTILGPKTGFLNDVERLISGMVELQTKVFVGATMISPQGRSNAQESKLAYGRDDGSAYAMKWIEKEASRNKEDIEIVRSEFINKLPKGLMCSAFECFDKNKHPALMTVLRGVYRKLVRLPDRSRRTLVFCNSVISCRSTSHFLEEEALVSGNEFEVTCLHGDLSAVQRETAWRSFFKDLSGAQIKDKDPSVHKVLVCTDILARGLDFSREVDHVIVFDLPSSVTDFIHRIGRTARGQDNKGYVTLLVGPSKKEKRIARVLMASTEHRVSEPVLADVRLGESIINMHRKPDSRPSSKSLLGKHSRLKGKPSSRS